MTILEQLEAARQDAQADGAQAQAPDCEEYFELAVAVSDTEVARLRPEWAKTARQIASEYTDENKRRGDREKAKRKRHLAILKIRREQAFHNWFRHAIRPQPTEDYTDKLERLHNAHAHARDRYHAVA